MKNTLVSLAFLGSLALLLGPPAQADCTIGVANGVVTQDARPLLFKSRMATTPGFNLVDRDDTGTYTYVGVRSSSDTNVNMGLNSAGLSMGNSLVDGLGGNFAFTAFCLANGADVPGIPWDPAYVATVSGCFPFMDATGNTVMYELHGLNWLLTYDALNPNRLLQDTYGRVIRANEWHMHADGTDDLTILGRYHTGRVETDGLIALDRLSALTLMQGYRQGAINFEFMRYGPGLPEDTIAVDSVTASMVVQGVLPGEDPLLSTMWIALGQPNFSIAVPVWVAVPNVPPWIGDTNMNLVDHVTALRAQNQETLTQASTFPAEARYFAEVNELMGTWRPAPWIAFRDMPRVEWRMAEDAHSLLACLATLDPDHQAPPVKIEMATGSAYIRFKGINISIDDLNVNTCNTWSYTDDFSTTKADRDSYQHSPIIPEGLVMLRPFLCYTRVLYQPPNTLAFSPGGMDAAEVRYRFPVFNEMPPILAYLTVMVRDLNLGVGTYELSTDGINWPVAGRLIFGPQRINLIGGHAGMWRYFRSPVPTATPVTYLWDFGDGQTSNSAEMWHNYAVAGTYLVSCTVTDVSGVSMTDYLYCVVP